MSGVRAGENVATDFGDPRDSKMWELRRLVGSALESELLHAMA
jgi:hypothetical protein